MEALHYLESLKCPGGCGNYVDEAHSRDWNWDVEHHKCYACAANDLIQRDFGKKNKNVEGATDGLLWTVTPVAPATK